MKKLLTYFIIFITAIGIASTVSLAPVGAIDITEKGTAESNTLKNDQGQKIEVTIARAISTLLFVLGIIAVIVIIIAGIRFATSNGDPGATKQARNAVLYAAIGLVIAIFAYGIVNFVISTFGSTP